MGEPPVLAERREFKVGDIVIMNNEFKKGVYFMKECEVLAVNVLSLRVKVVSDGANKGEEALLNKKYFEFKVEAVPALLGGKSDGKRPAESPALGASASPRSLIRLA